MRKRTVQTGPNNQLGGFQDGLLIVKYQLRTAGIVKTDPKKAAARVMVKEAKSFQGSFILIHDHAHPPWLQPWWHELCRLDDLRVSRWYIALVVLLKKC